uniref:Metalloproteinase n=1 Tax=Cydia pomonella granulosis virus TaxID=28289 RepID=A0A5B8GPN5_GVCP|nr:metalloproteinase [Cydia pomonella granulovirus]
MTRRLIFVVVILLHWCRGERLSLHFFLKENGTWEEVRSTENINGSEYINSFDTTSTTTNDNNIYDNLVDNNMYVNREEDSVFNHMPVYEDDDNKPLGHETREFLLGLLQHQFDVGGRFKRFFIHKQMFWRNRNNITYSVFIDTVPPTINVTTIKQETRFAFGVWEEAISHKGVVRFCEVGDNVSGADIKIVFARGEHGDKFSFDGAGGVLGHAFCPPRMGVKNAHYPSEGEVHLDSDEWWLTQDQAPTDNGTYYLPVVTHEIGHALGLYHSSVRNSIMYQLYNSDHLQLDKDDLNGLEQLYIDNEYYKNATNKTIKTTDGTDSLTTTYNATTTTPIIKVIYPLPDWVYETMSNSVHEICQFVPKCVACIRGEYYVFSEQKYWRFRDFELTDLIETQKFKQGLWPELCQVVGVVGVQQHILFVDHHLWFEYTDTTLDRVRVLTRNKYSALFAEEGVLFGVVDGRHLYEIEYSGGGGSDDSLVDRYRGEVMHKFEGVQWVDWVMTNDKEVSAGVGRGRWVFAKVAKRPDVGHVYRATHPIQPLMYTC